MALAQSHARPQQTYLAQQSMGRGGPSGLAEVLDVLLDKGLVIDAFVRVSLVGIELLTIDARVVIASVDTYLRFAEAVNRLDLLQVNNSQNLGDLVGGGTGAGARALSSRRPRQGSSQDEPQPEPDREGATSREEESGSHDGSAAQRGADEPKSEAPVEKGSPDGADGAAGDDKGFLTRIKERGQVF